MGGGKWLIFNKVEIWVRHRQGTVTDFNIPSERIR